MGLNNKLVDRLQNYYGMAIRSNVGDLNKMKKAIYAAHFYACSSEKDNYHAHCPTGVDSWCAHTTLHKLGAHTTMIEQIKRNYINLPRACQKKPLNIKLLVYDNINIERGYYIILGCIVGNSRIKNGLPSIIEIFLPPFVAKYVGHLEMVSIATYEVGLG